jgi:F1F0 ATPase subunit 2
MELGSVIVGIAACIGGIALGLAYFTAMRWSTDAFVKGDDWRQALLLTLARLAGAGIVFVIIAQAGAVALLSAFVGFLVARALALSSARENA